MICIFLEIFVFVYPPKGFSSTDVIILGNVFGSPLVEFPRIWNKLFNDDDFMLKVLGDSKIIENMDKNLWLNFLNQRIRGALSYFQTKDGFVKISFHQPSQKMLRPFLNCFTSNLLSEIRKIENEELLLRKEIVLSRLKLVSAQFSLLRSLTAEPSEMDFLLGLNPQKGNSFPQFPDFQKVSSSSSFLGIIEKYISNEIDFTRFGSILEWKKINITDSAFLTIYPRSSILLTRPETESKPVQPFLEIFYILIPLGMSIIFLGGLLTFNIPSQKSENLLN
ncbi:MAG: hypothetical protein HQM08_03190 [Candidatus Riflebacteria bacterium]|nr:hypothetical protein [Candidatus Riflebacteria bacterium]